MGETAPPGPDEDFSSSEKAEEPEIDHVAVTPQYVMNNRYKRTFWHPKHHEGEHPKVKALQTSFKSRPTVTSSNGKFTWTPCESPEGNLYFREENKNVLTLSDLYDQTYLDGVSELAELLLTKLVSQKVEPPEDAELVITFKDFGNYDMMYGYYLASWENRCVFWLDDTEYDFITDYARVCTTESHIARHIEFLFWVHVEMFPCHRGPPADVLEDIKDQLILGIYDHITSRNSIFPFEREDVNETLRCLEKIKSSGVNARTVWIVARCKQNLVEHAFLNYYGERGARIHRDDSVLHKSISKPRSWLFRITSLCLFLMPSVYMKEIDHVWIDNTVDWITWKRFVNMLTRDWEQSTTPATVILSANIGFLAIQSIDVGTPHRSAAQIASYISAVLAIFYYVICQVLARHHRNSAHFGAAGAGEFFERRQKQWLGLESVAITFSLPTALFIWSMLVFLFAMMVVFFWQTDLATRLSLGLVLLILLSITVLLLWLDWGTHKPDERERSMLYSLCPSGLRNLILGVKEKWQAQCYFQLRRRRDSSAASINSDTSTVVGSES